MNKLMIFLSMVFLLVGVVSAERVISDLEGIDIPLDNVFAGSPFEASFSFNYFAAPQNEDDSPLIIRLNISSESESYPVNKGEFVVSGVAQRYTFFGLIHIKDVEFECSEEAEQTIEHPKDAQNVTAPDGTFYCYNEEGDLSLNERDLITLEIISHQAIYPGEYSLSAELFYLTDERAPFVEILNVDVFDKYYREVDSVEVLASIRDGSEIVEKWGTAFLGYENLTFPFSHEDSDVHYFSRNTPVDIVEGDYPLVIFAEDEYGNRGSDEVTLKIDKTAPEIVLVQPNSSGIYGENDSLVIEVEVEDLKAGVNSSTVRHRISEIVNGAFCPDSGVIFGDYDCYNSGWISDWNLGDFVTRINISGSEFTSGSYWLEIEACDILGNCEVL